MKYNIIIVDDHKMFLEGLLSFFEDEEEYDIILTDKNGKNVIKYLEINPDEKIDLVITDISMPEVDGITLHNYIKENHPQIKTLVVSMHMDTNIIDTLIKDGVDGYVPKNAEKEELLAAVKDILEDKKYFSRNIREAYMNSVFADGNETMPSLTNREKEVLKLIALEHTTQEIADLLFLSKHTIESYRKTLILKLKVRNLAGLTKYAIKLGLID